MLAGRSRETQGEIDALTAFRLALRDPLGALDGWDEASLSAPCDWRGVACEPNAAPRRGEIRRKGAAVLEKKTGREICRSSPLEKEKKKMRRGCNLQWGREKKREKKEEKKRVDSNPAKAGMTRSKADTARVEVTSTVGVEVAGTAGVELPNIAEMELTNIAERELADTAEVEVGDFVAETAEIFAGLSTAEIVEVVRNIYSYPVDILMPGDLVHHIENTSQISSLTVMGRATRSL
ncbi:hypothetical protein ZIOFF_034635 [Zingiber officinale]|uniref:Leucine-rich repeat-containing N-terminal plant-type domain-containing protein n=1 Tax=Zingiber officinale TaxID=94328 RepID=A0A8J5H3Z0_ZINOF|nr:hypothetical protein ZIOFF_034635 [Zingiber officinale]